MFGCGWMKHRLNQRRADLAELESIRDELYESRFEELRCKRENDALLRALDHEECYADDLERELDAMQAQINDAHRCADIEEARRIAAEKAVAAGQMKVALLEKQVQALEEQQLAQERLYQDILREREETIHRLQDSQPKRRARKKFDMLEQQISIVDLLDDF